jgi:CRISPR-associated protein Csd2
LPWHDLFGRVRTWRVFGGERRALDDIARDNWPPARRFEDYAITVDRAGLPDTVEIIER